MENVIYLIAGLILGTAITIGFGYFVKRRDDNRDYYFIDEIYKMVNNENIPLSEVKDDILTKCRNTKGKVSFGIHMIISNIVNSKK